MELALVNSPAPYAISPVSLHGILKSAAKLPGKPGVKRLGTFNGYNVFYLRSVTSLPKSYHVDPDFRMEEDILWAMKGNRAVGMLTFDKHTSSYVTISTAQVALSMMRKGIGTAMYLGAIKYFRTVLSDSDVSRQARAMWFHLATSEPTVKVDLVRALSTKTSPFLKIADQRDYDPAEWKKGAIPSWAGTNWRLRAQAVGR